jgi:hypothetical protein
MDEDAPQDGMEKDAPQDGMDKDASHDRMDKDAPQSNLESPGPTNEKKPQKEPSPERRFGKDMRHLVKLVTRAFLNPCKLYHFIRLGNFKIFYSIRQLGHCQILCRTCPKRTRQETY